MPSDDAPRRPDSSGRRLIVPALLAVAGALAIASGLVKWASITFPRTGATTDTALIGNDTIALIVGVFLLVRAVMTWRGSEAQARSWGGWALVSGGLLLGYAIYDLATLRTRVMDSLVANTADAAGLSVAQVRAIIESQVAEGVVRFAFRPGISLAVAAGCMAIVAGVLSLTTSFSWTGDAPRATAEDPLPASDHRHAGLTGVEPDAMPPSGDPGDVSSPPDAVPADEEAERPRRPGADAPDAPA